MSATENKGKIIKHENWHNIFKKGHPKLVQRKRDSSLIYDNYVRQKEITLNTTTPLNVHDIMKGRSDDEFTVSDLKTPLLLSTLDDKFISKEM